MNLADNKQPKITPITIEDGQSRIILTVQRAYFENWERLRTERAIAEIINMVISGLPLYSLRVDARRSLYSLASRVLYFLRTSFAGRIDETRAALAVVSDRFIMRNKRSGVGWAETPSGKPLGYWNARDYIRKRVLPVMDKLAGLHALDPNDYTGRNSLRNLAEMEIRYRNHEVELYELKKADSQLVVASVHEDCSDRCYKWQGRVYSLDGSSGVTDDGRKYVPLETATDVYYTTKAGRTYKNGLLGFNCRHRLLPYLSGVKPQTVDRQTQQRQYSINNRQRQIEERIRYMKLREALYAGKEPAERKLIHNRLVAETKAYRAFCKANERAFYPERLQILRPATNEEIVRYREIEQVRTGLAKEV